MDNATICYCAKITSGEIEEAVKNGNATIPTVREYLNKYTQGNCKTQSPSGACCGSRFNEVINYYTNKE